VDLPPPSRPVRIMRSFCLKQPGTTHLRESSGVAYMSSKPTIGIPLEIEALTVATSSNNWLAISSLVRLVSCKLACALSTAVPSLALIPSSWTLLAQNVGVPQCSLEMLTPKYLYKSSDSLPAYLLTQE
jgi:hypothetical protein